MKVFVTGASGFIGSHVVRALINAGHTVLALTTASDNLWRLKDIRSHFEILQGRLEDSVNMKTLLSAWKPEVCIHLAWYAEPGKYLNSPENLNSLQGSLSLLQILSECGCKQFIGAGTCAEYKMKSEILAETDDTDPETLYAASKLSFQMLAKQICTKTDILFTWGRIFYPYGLQEDARRLIPSVILKLLKNEVFLASPGEQLRDYIHVTDVASAFLKLAEKQETGVFNICSSQPVTIKNLLEVIGDLMGKDNLLAYGALPYRDWEPMHIAGNNKKLKAIDWKPSVDLRSGLHDTIKWWEQEPQNILSKQNHH